MRQDIENPMAAPLEDEEVVGTDFFGNEILAGDEVYILDDEIFLYSELSQDAKMILEFHGAVVKYLF